MESLDTERTNQVLISDLIKLFMEFNTYFLKVSYNFYKIYRNDSKKFPQLFQDKKQLFEV